MTLPDHILLIVFTIGYPLYAFIAYRRIKPDLIANKPGLRVRDYKETILWLWTLAILAILLWILRNRSWTDIGMEFTGHWTTWASIALLVFGTGTLIWLDRTLQASPDQRLALKEKLLRASAYEYLPQKDSEFKWFTVVCVTAGICEEILYRGYLIWYFGTFAPTWVAVILSSVIFGLAHAYQGLAGIARTAVAGLVLAALYVFTGTLWIPVAVHIILDVYSGILGRNAFRN